MLIEAAKGGHTGVVSVLIDYNPNNLNTGAGSGTGAPVGAEGVPSGEVVSDNVANANATNTIASEDSLIPSTRYDSDKNVNVFLTRPCLRSRVLVVGN